MATIDDFGDTAEPLNNPVLGGPSGWAAAVRDAIAGIQDSLSGKVSKAGDEMTGALGMGGNPIYNIPAPESGDWPATKNYVDGNFIGKGSLGLDQGMRYGIQVLTSDGNGIVTVASVPADHILVSLFFGDQGNEIFCSLIAGTRNQAKVWHAQAPSAWANASGVFRWVSTKGNP